MLTPMVLMRRFSIRIEEYKNIAISMAEEALKVGEVPVAACIFDDKGKIVYAHNQVENLQDPCAHAEILAIKAACNKIGTKYLDQCSIYVTLEPCAMCLQALCFARIKIIYFGAYDYKNGGISCSNIISSSMNNYLPEIFGGIGEEESVRLLKNFFADKRQ